MVQGSLAESSVNCGKDKNQGGKLVWSKGHVAAVSAQAGAFWGTSESGGDSLTLSFLIADCKCLDRLFTARRRFPVWEWGILR